MHFVEHYYLSMPSKLSSVICLPRASCKDKNLLYIFVDGQRARVNSSLSIVSRCTVSLYRLLQYFLLFQSFFSSSLISTLFYHFQTFPPVSRSYAFQLPGFVRSYSSLPLLLFSTSLLPSHQIFWTMRMPLSKKWTFFFDCLSCLSV